MHSGKFNVIKLTFGTLTFGTLAGLNLKQFDFLQRVNYTAFSPNFQPVQTAGKQVHVRSVLLHHDNYLL